MFCGLKKKIRLICTQWRDTRSFILARQDSRFVSRPQLPLVFPVLVLQSKIASRHLLFFFFSFSFFFFRSTVSYSCNPHPKDSQVRFLIGESNDEFEIASLQLPARKWRRIGCWLTKQPTLDFVGRLTSSIDQSGGILTCRDLVKKSLMRAMKWTVTI